MTPIIKAIDQMVDAQLARHARIIRGAEQVRKWREEDRRNGIIWNDEISGVDQ